MVSALRSEDGQGMKDTFEFTLNNPLTEEQWDMISDVDFDRTDRITFHTKHGKEVEFTKVIRCRDCIHFSESIKRGAISRSCGYAYGCICPDPDGYCNFAETKRHDD